MAFPPFLFKSLAFLRSMILDYSSVVLSLKAYTYQSSSCLPSYTLESPQFSSVQFSRSVVSDSLRPHESQHATPPCPSPTPGVHSDSRPSSRWCHPAISFSGVPFSSCPQSLPASESFPMSPRERLKSNSAWASLLTNWTWNSEDNHNVCIRQ